MPVVWDARGDAVLRTLVTLYSTMTMSCRNQRRINGRDATRKPPAAPVAVYRSTAEACPAVRPVVKPQMRDAKIGAFSYFFQNLFDNLLQTGALFATVLKLKCVLFIFTAAVNVLFYPAFVCMFVGLSVSNFT